jgi:hypothetical protein
VMSLDEDIASGSLPVGDRQECVHNGHEGEEEHL